jgi:hypothetical protein
MSMMGVDASSGTDVDPAPRGRPMPLQGRAKPGCGAFELTRPLLGVSDYMDIGSVCLLLGCALALGIGVASPGAARAAGEESRGMLRR